MGGSCDVNQALKDPGRCSGLGAGSADPFRLTQSSLEGTLEGALPGAGREAQARCFRVVTRTRCTPASGVFAQISSTSS